MKRIVGLAAAFLAIPIDAAAQRAKAPADATVFIRLIGTVHAEIDEVVPQTLQRRVVDRERVEIGSGSGFVISPYGHVLTNDHVIKNPDQFLVTDGNQRAKVTVTVSNIEVCFPPSAAAVHGLAAPCSEASVAASDPTLDLAVLSISATNLPYLALGDSDSVAVGLPIDALGYPFGRAVEVGKTARAPEIVPEVSTTSGTISALRAGDTGELRYLQISNSVNPGNSGGPIVDRDGFALGVTRMGLRRGEGIAFVIPINEAKDFLESRGLAHLMPTRRLRLGSFQRLENKSLGLRLVEGAADTSPFRSHVETETQSSDISLRIDRVLTPWNSKRIEDTLVGTQVFERAALTSRQGYGASRSVNTALTFGHATGNEGGRDVRMEYAVLDLGTEKLVARYVGPAERIAFNESVLHESLASLDGQSFPTRELGPVDTLAWSPAETREGQRVLPVPQGWVVEAAGPTPCSGLPQPSAVASAFPEHDLSLAVRVAVWAGGVVPETAAAACSSIRGSLGSGSYASRGEWLGLQYIIEGAFTRVGPQQIMQLEVFAVDRRSAFARALLTAWIKRATE